MRTNIPGCLPSGPGCGHSRPCLYTSSTGPGPGRSCAHPLRRAAGRSCAVVRQAGKHRKVPGWWQPLPRPHAEPAPAGCLPPSGAWVQAGRRRQEQPARCCQRRRPLPSFSDTCVGVRRGNSARPCARRPLPPLPPPPAACTPAHTEPLADSVNPRVAPVLGCPRPPAPALVTGSLITGKGGNLVPTGGKRRPSPCSPSPAPSLVPDALLSVPHADARSLPTRGTPTAGPPRLKTTAGRGRPLQPRSAAPRAATPGQGPAGWRTARGRAARSLAAGRNCRPTRPTSG